MTAGRDNSLIIIQMGKLSPRGQRYVLGNLADTCTELGIWWLCLDFGVVPSVFWDNLLPSSICAMAKAGPGGWGLVCY